MQIKCPECDAVLSLSRPKAGNYKPTCKHCQQKFRLKVTADDPPKVGVGRIKKAATVEQTIVQDVDATIESSSRKKVESTVVQSNAADATAVDATVDEGSTGAGSLASVGQTAATMASGVQSLKSADSPIVRSGGSSSAKSDPKDSSISDMPTKLGGYRIVKLLGRGAMGAVYEAKQVSLDRQVALKTIRDRLIGNPSSLARFVREAYAAAQLTHHNVVQIYDFGEDDGRHYFSMEWVRGGPLDDVVRQKGSLDPKIAAGYALQASRGLQFAHRHGMVHRDVKPANLLLSDDGVIKVADLGLVKIPDQADIESTGGITTSAGISSGTEVTMQGTAVGTPAYMAPEQTVDAANVDHRADIYSLGCTLFYLLTGRPPFDGSVASEVMHQHAHQIAPDVTDINARVPRPLADIVKRSIAKRPADRYPSLVEFISDLESYLGLSQAGEFSPTSGQADRWEQIVGSYSKATALEKLQTPLLLAAIIGGLLLTLVTLGLGLSWWLTGPAIIITAIATPLAMSGNQSAVVGRMRSWFGTLSIIDWASAVLGAVLFLIVVVFAGMWPGVIVGAIVGGFIGAAYQIGLVVPTNKRAADPLQDAQRFVRDLRINGADESGLRSFAARYAGGKWQALFERLFGYDSLLEMRLALAKDPSFDGSIGGNSIRDRVCANLATRTVANRQPDLQKRLAKVERLGLESEGMSAAEAEDRSWAMAQAIMKGSQAVAAGTGDAEAAAQAKRDQMKAMLAEARSGKFKIKRDKLAPLRFALGGPTRLIAGCGLLAIFAIWGNHQGLFDSIKDIETLKQIGSGSADFDQLGSAVRDAAVNANQSDDKTTMVGGGVSPWSVAVAGLLMAMSAFVSGWRMSIPAAIATVVILFGPSLGIPGVGDGIPAWAIAAAAGVVIYIPGILFGEKR
ncbi:Serine/threonine-protein kinase StkP [Rubripirellula tenax]|uniref:Serine/threonine-protein kinase StkP n=1 Tax=Rubripirellula tenax TaxID=2528015 RepID=A0A5C6EUU5_9BACT|nr:serine/threonine-protein kinase [Rubripirellula tenax]TWU51071.1 Serine/threonine-protein kinase StkP [Rubripirellula tenax]